MHKHNLRQHRKKFDQIRDKMLARTELMNASRECYDDKMAEEGFDVMRLTVSGEPCDSCSRYENRLFSLTGATAGLPTKADLEAAGVFHPNCTHTYVLVPDYIRLRDYNPDGTRKQAVSKPEGESNHSNLNTPIKDFARIEGEHSIFQDSRATNPNYEFNPNSPYFINCQRCVPTYEARRRGFDVEALPAIMQGNDDVASKWQTIFENAVWMNNRSSLPDKTFVEEQMKKFGNGSRAEVYVAWQDSGAHVFVAENQNGHILFHDPQAKGKDASAYFSLAKQGKTLVCRIDNLKFSNYIKLCCKEVKK